MERPILPKGGALMLIDPAHSLGGTFISTQRKVSSVKINLTEPFFKSPFIKKE